MAEHNKRSTTLDVKYIHGYTHVLGPFFTIEAQNGYHTISKTQDAESNPAGIRKGFLTHSNLVWTGHSWRQTLTRTLSIQDTVRNYLLMPKL